jgi:membrane fusion protein (multidrug efflux system)
MALLDAPADKAAQIPTHDDMPQTTRTIIVPETVGPTRTPLLRRPWMVMLLAGLAICGIIFGASAMFHSLTHESTDDAFIDSHVISIAPKIAGRVSAVRVNDNQIVKKGDVLIDIDPADAESVVAQKRAARDVAAAKARNAETAAQQADAHLGTVRAAYEAAGASADAARADTNKLRGDLQRNQHLIASGAISKQDFEHSAIDTKAAEATLDSKKKQMDAAGAYMAEAEKQAESAHVQIEAARAETAEAEAALRQAELHASYAKVTAPEDGRVTSKAIEAGNYIQVGQALMAIVSPNVWVTANYKETQLRDMRPGEHVLVSVDAYPGRKLRAHVDSIQAGSGARFSLLPPENATGNYVKVVQRVPVKIVFDEELDVQRVLGPGLSAIPDVQTGGGFATGVKVAAGAILLIFLVIIGAAVWIGKAQPDIDR